MAQTDSQHPYRIVVQLAVYPSNLVWIQDIAQIVRNQFVLGVVVNSKMPVSASVVTRKGLQMGDPHNPARSGAWWNSERLSIQLAELTKIKDLVTVSGGWAWHFMSPLGHKEIKTQHDHKDQDVIVKPELFNSLLLWFKESGYQRQRTQWDNPSVGFYRYTKWYEGGKVVFDVFLENVPFIEVNGFRVVEPNALLAMYGVKHTSEQCLAVVEARKLLAKGISPVGRPELVY